MEGYKMKIVATVPVRNEDWVLGLSGRAMMRWVDHAVFLDHASTDRTPEILAQIAEEFPGRVTILNESGQVWEEMRHRQRLLDEARAQGATHIALVDADEILTANLLSSIRGMFEHLTIGNVLQLPWLCLRGGIRRYHASGVWGEQNVSTGFADDPALHWKARGPEGYDYHHRHPMGRYMCPVQGVGRTWKGRDAGLMHLQFVSGRRLRAKQCLYKLQEVTRGWVSPTNTIDEINRRYNLAVYGNEHKLDLQMGFGGGLREAPAAWWDGYEDLMQYFHPHAEPWQEAEALRILQEHGAAKFAGLDLFGLDEPEIVRHGIASEAKL